MLVLFSYFIIGFSLWTAFALITKGQKHSEIKEVSNEILSNIKSLIYTFRKLFRLLIQDLLTNNTSQTIDDFSKKNYRKETFEEPRGFIVNDFDDEDKAIIDFSQEVIDVITEEENKAA
ncbi:MULTISPECIES: hypothetical protein [Prochlorococcus]|uniref:hypothetical protein n=1 Tax=Prochlorococcus TaxID=1218 RepID=UPI00053383C7|nr:MULTISPECIES: hypothetical protein [Prochlorococcus]KGG12164.1 5'-phosphoribosylglycinamide transformylase [Prochlorococcus sp. MIT 0601]